LAISKLQGPSFSGGLFEHPTKWKDLPTIYLTVVFVSMVAAKVIKPKGLN